VFNLKKTTRKGRTTCKAIQWEAWKRFISGIENLAGADDPKEAHTQEIDKKISENGIEISEFTDLDKFIKALVEIKVFDDTPGYISYSGLRNRLSTFGSISLPQTFSLHSSAGILV